MPTGEERLAYLEGQVGEHSHAFVEIRESVRHLEQRMDTRFDAVEKRFEGMDRRFKTIDRRFEMIDRRFETVDRRFESLEQTASRHFVWLVGMQVTTLVTTLAAIVGVLFARA